MKSLLEDLKAEPEANGLDEQGNPICNTSKNFVHGVVKRSP